MLKIVKISNKNNKKSLHGEFCHVRLNVALMSARRQGIDFFYFFIFF